VGKAVGALAREHTQRQDLLPAECGVYHNVEVQLYLSDRGFVAKKRRLTLDFVSLKRQIFILSK